MMRVLMRTTAGPASCGPTDRPAEFHRRLPGYLPSPLVEAPALAARLGVAQVFIKNECWRFGLPSFKILGASWAVYATLRDRFGPLPEGDLSPQALLSWAAPARPLTLMAATDGNHGRAVARVARWFGLKSRIFVPGFVAPERSALIESEGAELRVIDGVYDAAVDAAAAEAEQDAGAILISDTARQSSEIIPQRVTAGYTTAFAEAEEQLAGMGVPRIDALALQAGVGGLAAAGTSWARSMKQGQIPRVIVVEPERAAAIMAALAAGEPVSVSAEKLSAMSVLQCGTVSLTAFPILNAGVDCCLAIEDDWARMAASEIRKCGIHTGLSGAAGAAGLFAALSGPFAEALRHQLGLFSRARLLVIATEAAAAPEQALASGIEAEEMPLAEAIE